jgi:predicted transcriptional regulator
LPSFLGILFLIIIFFTTNYIALLHYIHTCDVKMTSNNSSTSEPRFLQIPPEKIVLQLLNQGIKEAKISQRKLAQALETDQASISRKLSGKRSFRLDELSDITLLILEQLSSLPQKAISEFGVSSENTVTVSMSSSVEEAAEKMSKGDFTQLPVFDEKTQKYVGIVTDFTLLRRMLSPFTVEREEWVNQLKKMAIKDAIVIDACPIFSSTSSVIEIAHALFYHYAVLIEEENRKVGIITRWDFLQLLCTKK